MVIQREYIHESNRYGAMVENMRELVWVEVDFLKGNSYNRAVAEYISKGSILNSCIIVIIPHEESSRKETKVSLGRRTSITPCRDEMTSYHRAKKYCLARYNII